MISCHKILHILKLISTMYSQSSHKTNTYGAAILILFYMEVSLNQRFNCVGYTKKSSTFLISINYKVYCMGCVCLLDINLYTCRCVGDSICCRLYRIDMFRYNRKYKIGKPNGLMAATGATVRNREVSH